MPRKPRSSTLRPPDDGALPSGPTGRTIVTLSSGSPKAGIAALKDLVGGSVALASDFAAAGDLTASQEAPCLLLDQLDIAIVDGDPEQVASLDAAVADGSTPVLSVEPEQYVQHFAADDDAHGGLLSEQGRAYLSGIQRGVSLICDDLLAAGSGGAEAGESDALAAYADTSQYTWGLQATRVDRSPWSGRGIRIAVLDTGFDFAHPDFAGRSIVSATFVPGQSEQDRHSHGTHCIGTACGPKQPAGGGRRYGVAYESTILVGKVLGDSGGGQQGWILAGMEWAIRHGATVISMSLGSAVAVGQTHSPAYERAGRLALDSNCLVVAAAGNGGPTPVSAPANCPSIMAVASVDSDLRRASSSCIGLNPDGGEVDIAGPGVAVHSSVPMPGRYGTKSGTSMATPHVAGIAALWAQAEGLRGQALWRKLTATARALGQPAQHVGAGLVQAPIRRRPFDLPFPPWRLPIRRPLPLSDGHG